MRRLVTGLVAMLALCAEAAAEEPTKPDSVFVFGGPFTTGYMGQSIVPFTAGIEGTMIGGVAYHRILYEAPFGLQIGSEIGAAGRFGWSTTGELWTGMSLGYRGFRLGPVQVAPMWVVGFSMVTGPGAMEPYRIQEYAGGNGDPTFLFYLGPELAFRHRDRPDTEFVYRLHHRSGGWHTFGNMRGGNNAQVFGIRRRF